MNEGDLSAEAFVTSPLPTVQFYIPATSSLQERRPRTLKHGNTFGVFDHYGDIAPGESSPEGLFHDDTRFLSHQELTVDGARPLHLGSNTKDDSSLLLIELMNPDMRSSGPQGTVGSIAVNAACAGVWLHGAAGDLVASRIGPVGVPAGRIADWLPAVFRALVEGSASLNGGGPPA